MPTRRDVMGPLLDALRGHGVRQADWMRAKRMIEHVLNDEAISERDLARDYGLSADGTTLTVGRDEHQFVLSFGRLPSGNVRVAYTSPYVEQRPNEPVHDVLIGVQDAVIFTDANNVCNYMFEFYRLITEDMRKEEAKTDPLPK